MRNIKPITTEDELKREITDSEQKIDQQKLKVSSAWISLKESAKPSNLIKGIFNRSPEGFGIVSELPVTAAKIAAGFLLNRWMVKKTYGVTKVAAGMALQSGLAHFLAKWVAKKFQKKTDHKTVEQAGA
jgi:hypothetical protein